MSEFISQGLQVIGISKSASRLSHANYQHVLLDISDNSFEIQLTQIVTAIDKIDITNLAFETKVMGIFGRLHLLGK